MDIKLVISDLGGFLSLDMMFFWKTCDDIVNQIFYELKVIELKHVYSWLPFSKLRLITF